MHIFEGKTAEEDEDTMYDVRVSYIEIYNEEIRLSYFCIFPYVLFFSFYIKIYNEGIGSVPKIARMIVIFCIMVCLLCS